MNAIEKFLAELLLKEIKEKLAVIDNEKLRLICEAYAEQLVPVIVEQYLEGKDNNQRIKDLSEGYARKQIKDIGAATIIKVLEKVNDSLPDGPAKNLLNNEILDIAQSSWATFMDKGDWQSVVKEKAGAYAASHAKDLSHEAIDKVREKLPNNQYSAAICDDADKIAQEIIEGVKNGDSLEVVCYQAEKKAKQSLKKQVGKYSKAQLNASIDFSIEYMANKAREKGRGKRYSKYNKQVDKFADITKNSLKDNVAEAVDRLLDGDNFEDVAESFAKTTARQITEETVREQAAPFVSDLVKKGTKSVHVGGKGSRKINKHIDAFGGEAADSLASNFSNNVMDVVAGNKDIDTAVKDIAVDTAKDTARNYLEKHGAELAKEGIETITKEVAKKMGNQAAKEVVLAAGSKLANVNTITAVAGAVIDIGTSFKAYLDGEITKAQLLRQIGEKGSAACVSSVWGIAGGMVGGPVGAAIGSMVGYIASSMLYGSVLQAFENEEVARQRAAQTHAFCEAAIASMRRERAEFERQTQELFRKRDVAARKCFEAMDKAIFTNDFNKFSQGLNEIAKSFGKELQFTTFEEFDAFMESDEDFDL